ncbi:MAG: MCE family protein [Actinomycetota bacterium]|nr:MCE family protein [Actinomycetota bacterium]
MSFVRRAIGPLIVGALVVAGALTIFGGDDGQKTLTAYFPRTVSLYEGSDVRVLGVAIGQVDTITPEGTRVKVTMSYDEEVQIPAEAEAVIISPSIVGDRYVQLTPAYTEGDALASGESLDETMTSVPLELDEIYSSLDRLTVALGPNGANKKGALTDLLEVTAENFGGQGATFNQTIKDFSSLSATLDNNKEELFSSTEKLGNFIETIADNDGTVRRFNRSLASVSNLLAGERQELAASLNNLSTALGEVGTFVEENKDSLGRNITGINRIAKVLVKQRVALDESLSVAPVALNNLALTYNPDTGTLDTNANLGNLEKDLAERPTEVLCALVSAQSNGSEICDALEGLGLPRSGPFGAGTGANIPDPFDPTLGGLVGGTS